MVSPPVGKSALQVHLSLSFRDIIRRDSGFRDLDGRDSGFGVFNVRDSGI